MGNTLLWKLLFAGPAAKSCFSLTLSLSLSLSFFTLLFLARSASFFTFFAFFPLFPFVPLLALYRSLSRSSSPLPSAFLFLPHTPRLCHHSFFILLHLPLPSLPFCLCKRKKQKEQASIIFLSHNCYPQLQQFLVLSCRHEQVFWKNNKL